MSVHRRKVHAIGKAIYNETLNHSAEDVSNENSLCNLETESKEQISNLKRERQDKDYGLFLSEKKLQN